jgi:hypothetical protein
MTHDPIRDWQAKRQAQRDAAETDARARQAARLEERGRLAFVTAGGDEGDFKKEWPAIRQELLRDETIKSVRGEK